MQLAKNSVRKVFIPSSKLSRDVHILHVVVHVIDMKSTLSTMDVTFSGMLSLCLHKVIVACACIIMPTDTHSHVGVIGNWRVTLQRVTVFGAVVIGSNGQVGESVSQYNYRPCSHSSYPISY